MHNVSVTPKLVKKVIINLAFSKASLPNCVPVVLLKNFEPDLSYMLPELFKMCLKESCFPDCWKVSSVVRVFKNVRERSMVKKYFPVGLLSVVSKVFEELVNKSLVDHLEICGILFWFPLWFQIFSINFRSSGSCIWWIAKAFNRYGATQVVALVISKPFHRVWNTGFLYKIKPYGISSQVLYLVSYFLSNRQFRVFLDGKSLHEYSINAGVSQRSTLNS